MVKAITPWVVFNHVGRVRTGLTRAKAASDYLVGAAAASVCFGLGYVLYGKPQTTGS